MSTSSNQALHWAPSNPCKNVLRVYLYPFPYITSKGAQVMTLCYPLWQHFIDLSPFPLDSGVLLLFFLPLPKPSWQQLCHFHASLVLHPLFCQLIHFNLPGRAKVTTFIFTLGLRIEPLLSLQRLCTACFSPNFLSFAWKLMLGVTCLQPFRGTYKFSIVLTSSHSG